MSLHSFDASRGCAEQLDHEDALARWREQFHFPTLGTGRECLYFCGNSLGLQPRTTKAFVEQELSDWADMGVEGHVHARQPWMPYHESLTEQTARLVGAKPIEVVVMNSLTVNLHLMLVSFYRPTKQRYKIIIEGGAFPSDRYAVVSQAQFHGFDPSAAIIELQPRTGEATLRIEDIVAAIQRHGDELALVLLGQVNYLTGQAFDTLTLARETHRHGAVFGLDLAHGAGNLLLQLHEWNVDFAVWCSYKYLNGGPGAIAGCFVHEKHAHRAELPRFAGWWGHDKQTRFAMGPHFVPIPGAEGWQLSNPPILQMAALRASMQIFDAATMPALRAKTEKLTAYLEFLLYDLPAGFCEQLTPRDVAQRGTQLSLRIGGGQGKALIERLKQHHVICDLREPDVMRVAPAALYTRFIDVYNFAAIMREHALENRHSYRG